MTTFNPQNMSPPAIDTRGASGQLYGNPALQPGVPMWAPDQPFQPRGNGMLGIRQSPPLVYGAGATRPGIGPQGVPPIPPYPPPPATGVTPSGNQLPQSAINNSAFGRQYEPLVGGDLVQPNRGLQALLSSANSVGLPGAYSGASGQSEGPWGGLVPRSLQELFDRNRQNFSGGGPPGSYSTGY